MRKVLLCAAAIVCVAACGTVANAQCGTLFGECLVNGNLDLGTPGDGTMTGTNPPWTVTNNLVDAAIFQPGFADNTIPGNAADEGLGIWYRAFRGGGTSGNPPVDANLSQTTVPVLMGGTYRLTFDRVVENNFTADSMTATLSSSSGPSTSVDLLTKKVTNAGYTGGGFNQVGTTAPEYNITETLLLSGVVPGDTLTVSLAMVGGVAASSNPQSAVADRFSLVRVPEPTSVALGLLGLCGLLGLIRRR
jgi:MYXO-CTERM domain-containing protein